MRLSFRPGRLIFVDMVCQRRLLNNPRMMNLIFVAGASPQIITETAFRLLSSEQRYTQIHVLTTVVGRDLIERHLLRRGGQWNRFRRSYPAARAFELSAKNVTVLHDGHGRPLEDIRTSADNTAAADQIAAAVRKLTRDGSPPLHASIAGGRKTMGYLLAAAMMLYGRSQDRLSHVLVRPAELEGTDFYFPERTGKRNLTFRGAGGKTVRVRREDIDIQLAELPFLRLRALRMPEMPRDQPFSELVDRCQADLDLLAAPQLRVEADGRRLLCGSRPVRLSPMRFLIYELLAERRRRGCGRTGCSGCDRCFVPAADITGSFAETLRHRAMECGSWGGRAETWALKMFLAEKSKINDAIRAVLGASSRLFEIASDGERGAKRYGLRLSPETIELG